MGHTGGVGDGDGAARLGAAADGGLAVAVGVFDGDAGRRVGHAGVECEAGAACTAIVAGGVGGHCADGDGTVAQLVGARTEIAGRQLDRLRTACASDGLGHGGAVCIGEGHGHGGARLGGHSDRTCDSCGLSAGGPIAHARTQGESRCGRGGLVECVDQRLQFAQAVGLGTVVGFGSNGRQQCGQIVGRDAGGVQADLGEVGHSERWTGCTVIGHRLDGVGDAGQLVDLGDGVHVHRLQCPYDVVEQSQVLHIGCSVAEGGTDRSVLRGGRILAVGISSSAVGLGQDGVVGVDDDLHFTRGVGGFAIDGSAGQGVLYGDNVARADTADTCAVEVGGGGCRAGGADLAAGVVFSVSTDGV